MAKFTIDDHIDFGNNGYHDATTWQVALDKNFEHIIDESIYDKVNVKTWITPLPVIGSPDEFYADLDAVYCRVKAHLDDIVSDWFYLGREEVITNGVVTGYTWPGVLNQNDQVIKVTEVDNSIAYYDSIADNFN